MKKLILALIAVSLVLVSCQSTKNADPIQHLEYMEAHMDEGFVTGKTDYHIQAMMVAEPYDTYNELELAAYHVEDDGISVVLKGTLGEEWVTKVAKVIKSYTNLDGTALTEEDFTANKGTFKEIKTKPSPTSNFAFFVPKKTVVEVQTAWGDTLYANESKTNHGKGDYLVCANVDGKPDLSDVWVVNGAVFMTTYNQENNKKH